ncbi:UDP-N-acetylglucosamine 2-epimerase [Spongiibacter taiwanensis]|uniref:UDP-N-acetyl glucosamine 2-epimerase n=1 Tax=Spongiibacter taiwanensis TaxID=1748242 RepID=UPI002035C5C4|nr:UDP-N-acetylglucosamine 2-epimerase [Spongiibacter taiwanensis]USA44254.1 UDP-N-acetylglucosamine 2-epimerase [Spongiibacter taiwanensis]
MIQIILGTKAQLIKMAPVMTELNAQGIPYRFISTGQHRDTMTELLENFGLRGPDYTLYSGKDITSVISMAIWASRILLATLFKKRQIFGEYSKGIVLVHGDTFSTLLGALMGKFARLKVGHIESGLRSHNWFHPFPEELTRVMVFRLTDYYFCPDENAVANLSTYRGTKINTGANTLLDALRLAETNIDNSDVNIPQEAYAVVSLHRFENIRNERALTRAIELIELLAKQNIKLVFILHNPTKIKLKKFHLYARLAENSNIELRQRYDYFKFIKLIKHSDFVISDGGSNQEECAYLGKPTLLLRKATERQEGLGENCVISEFNENVVLSFFYNYKQHDKLPLSSSHSPSKKIAFQLKAISI